MSPALAPTASRRGRLAAILVASLVPGAIDVAHGLARGGRIEPSYLAFTTAGVLVKLVVLTATFDVCLRRRMTSGACFGVSAAVAVGLGVIEGFAAWGPAIALDLPLVEPAH